MAGFFLVVVVVFLGQKKHTPVNELPMSVLVFVACLNSRLLFIFLSHSNMTLIVYYYYYYCYVRMRSSGLCQRVAIGESSFCFPARPRSADQP